MLRVAPGVCLTCSRGAVYSSSRALLAGLSLPPLGGFLLLLQSLYSDEM